MNLESPQPTARVADFLDNKKWQLLTIAAVITVALWYPASQIRFEQTIESFFAESSPFLRPYLKSKASFGGDEFLVVGFPVDDPTDPKTLDDIEKLSQALSEVPGILSESMQDLATILRNDRAPGWMRVAMRLPTFQHSIVDESRQMLVSEDDHTVAIAMRLQNVNDAKVPRAETFRRVRELARQHHPPAVVAGEPLQVYDMFQYVEQDSRTLGLASSALLMGVIMILFRSLRWVVLPIVLIHVTLIWTQGVLELSGMKLSMVSSMLTSLVTIIGVATMMHVTLVFRDHRQLHSRVDAFRLTYQRLAGPIFWTCLSTGVGFAALLTSNIVPVRSFAIMMSLATALIPIVCCLVLPVGILAGSFQADPGSPVGEKYLAKLLGQICRWSIKHPRVIVLTTVIIAGFAGAGFQHVHVETDFSKNFRPASPIIQAIDFFESRMGGIGTWEIGFSAPSELNEEFLDEVRTLTAKLEELKLPDGTGLTKVISITDGIDLVPKVPLETSGQGRLLPIVRRLRPATLDEKLEFLSTLQPEMEPSLYHAESGTMRIMLRALERQPAEVKLQLIQEVERLAHEQFPDAQATGLYVLLANMISSLLSDQLVSFLLAACGVTLMMTIAFRNWFIGLLSIIPNVLPIVLLIGTMSWCGIPLNIGTAMIASVSMGLTVDSTIHYLSSYISLREQGESHVDAAVVSHQNVGLALVLANLALVAGFTVLTLSNFVPLADFGVLVSVAMIGGLISNVVLMPVLLSWVKFPNATRTLP